ncbi:MAG: penicillin-binding protein 1A, partial [bacterium]|nr:penicillin-binding protein 1A [bacterium]
MVILRIIQWIMLRAFALLKGILFLVLFILLCSTAFVNGFLSEVVKDLPLIESLGVPDLAMTSKIYAADGTLLGDVFGEENRVLIGWHQIPEDLRDAIVAVEDQDFYSHPGFDIRGMVRAMFANLSKGSLKGQGASTLTQQLVRALYLSNEQTFERKIAEIILAVKIEQKYSKDEILTFYLNQVYFGSNAYGVEAAAQTYFGKSVSECDLAQCALLAGLPQAPSRLSPYVSIDAARERRTHVLTRMMEEGNITQEEFDTANNSEIALTGRRDIGFTGLQYPYFSTYVIHEVQEKFGLRKIYTEGLRIYTTLNPDWQAFAQQTVTDKVAEYANANVSQGALVTIEVGTGAIRAMVGGTTFNDSEFNRAWQALRQPGSSFKPYVYLTAMEDGFSPSSLVRDEPVEFYLEGWGTYRPKNYDYGYRGIMTLASALAASRNIPAVKIVDIVGAQRVADVAKACGIQSEIRPSLSMGIGTSEVTLLEHTTAYSTFANDGVLCQPYAIERITDARGNLLYTHEPSDQQVVDPNAVRLLVSMMQGVITGGTGTRARITGHHIAGKTGTTDDWRDAWFMAFTPSIVTGVWIGNDDNSSMYRVTGGIYPAVIWHDYMEHVLADMPDEEFPAPSYPRYVRAVDRGDSQALLASEKELQDLAAELGVDPAEYTLEQLRAAQARGDVFGNL